MKTLYFLAIFLIGCNQPVSNEVIAKQENKPESKPTALINSDNLKHATFGAGCFWCTEAVFEEFSNHAIKKV